MPILEIIFSGFVSKVINDITDVSKDKIRKAVKSKNTKHQNIESQIYNITVDVFNMLTNNEYRNNQDKIYDTAEDFLKLFKKNKKDELGNIKSCLQVLSSNVDENRCMDFKIALYEELGKEGYGELYRAILLLLLEKKNQYDYIVYEQLNQKLNEVILILGQKQDKDESKIAQRKVKSRTLEYADKWNQNMFLNDFDKRDENAGMNIKLKEVYLEEFLPHYTWRVNQYESDDLKDLLSEYVHEKGNNKMLLILGQPGIGKSTLITWFTANFIDIENRIMIYRFASDLKNVSGNDVLEELNLQIEDLENKILILDGLDEISLKNDRAVIINGLYQNLVKVNSIKNFSLIITCRENYIELYRVECNYITLQPWSIGQIERFCEIYSQKAKCKVSKRTMKVLLGNNKILGIPLILYMVLALNISIDTEGSIVDVYDQIFSLDGGIYDRCINRKRYANSHRIGEIKNQLHRISEKIAFWIFENNPDEASIPHENYEMICEIIMQEQDNEDANIKRDFLIGNYFKLVKHCEGVEADELYFIHRSIYEYFVAEFICLSIKEVKSIDKLAGVLGELLKKNKISQQMLEYLKYKIRKCELSCKFNFINEAFRLMLRDGMTYYTYSHYKNVINCELNIFANMLEIIHLWENRRLLIFDTNISKYLYYNDIPRLNLSKTNFGISEINLHEVVLIEGNLVESNFEGVDLSRTLLTGANLTRAILEGLNMEKMNLTKTILQEANMKRVNLREANLRGADLSGADLRGANLWKVGLKETKLERAKLERTIWNEEDIYKMKSRLTNTIFTHIIVENKTSRRIIHRNELFSD